MSKRSNKLIIGLSVLLSLIMALQGPAMAQVMVSISLPIIIQTKLTTHPDEYRTQYTLKMTSPVVCDLDCDNILDIISVGFNSVNNKSNIYVWQRNGLIKSGWPIEINEKVENTPAVGDMDGDGDLEIVVSAVNPAPATGGKVYAWHHDGTLYNGYPVAVNDYAPGAPLLGDVSNGLEEDPIVYNAEVGLAVCDMNADGKKEVIIASPFGMDVINGSDVHMEGWPVRLLTVGTPVAGDVDGNGKTEVFLAVKTPDANYIYGWNNDGTAINGWPVNIAGVVNAPGSFLSIADIDGDGIAEIISGSKNGWIAGWRLNGTVAFSHRPQISEDRALTNEIYQPIVGDINNDNNMEIIATSKYGNIYCYDQSGNPLNGWPMVVDYELSQGAVLVDIEADSSGDVLNPEGDLELLVSGSDGKVHSIDLPGNFLPNRIQWGMSGYNSRNSNNYQRDWNTAGWFVFDGYPENAVIESVYDWNRGGRVVQFAGDGVNNGYLYMSNDGRMLDSKNTTLQWSMSFGEPFYIYVSIDTLMGKRYLYYTPTDGDQPQDGNYIHHGLGGDAKNGRWHTFSRQLVTDLKNAEPNNEIIDVNAVYVQGSGRVDELMLIQGLSCVDLINLGLSASVRVSSGNQNAHFLNDGNSQTVWTSGPEGLPWLEYSWENGQRVNRVVLNSVTGARNGILFITDSQGNVYRINFVVPADGGPIEIVFNPIDNVRSITALFSNADGAVGVSEMSVYYDPNAQEQQGTAEEEYSTNDYIRIKDKYFFNPVVNNYWIPHGAAYLTWNYAEGQWQAPFELERDLDMMAGIGINAIKVDFMWKHIVDLGSEGDPFDWTRYDMLLTEAQEKGIKVFPVLDTRLPPDGIPQDWYSMHPQNENHPDAPWLSNTMSYEDPIALGFVVNFLQAVVERYSVGGEREDLSSTIAGWILGNQISYFNSKDLEYDGYDPDSQRAFREWLENRYNSIDELNTAWGQDNVRTVGYLPNYPYDNFDEVDMPVPFGYQAETRGQFIASGKASWRDIEEWREESIAKFVALAAVTIKEIDPNHLISYASMAVHEAEGDWQYGSEDAAKIHQACIAAGAPLDFWSINNYVWGLEGTSLVSGKSGIEKARRETGLPVMVTETGFSSTETIFPGLSEERQAKLVKNAVWEALECGAIGVCLFHWNDREGDGLADREKGFGIVGTGRDYKPAYYTIKEAYQKMDSLKINELLPLFTEFSIDAAIVGSPLITSNYMSLGDYSKTLLGFINSSPNTAETVSFSSGLFAGKTVKDIINDEIIYDNSNGVIERSLESDGHILLLVYNAGQGTGSPGDDDRSGQEGQNRNNQNTQNQQSQQSSQQAASNQTQGSTPSVSESSTQPSSVSSADGTSSTGASGLTLTNAVPTFVIPSDSAVGQASSLSNNLGGPATVVIIEEDKDKKYLDNGIGNLGAVQTAADKKQAGTRTYLGEGRNNVIDNKADSVVYPGAGSQMPEQQRLGEYPPIEQFRKNIEVSVNNQPGFIRTQPAIIPRAQMEAIVKQPVVKSEFSVPSVNLSNVVSTWISKFKSWWQNMSKTVKLAKKSLTSRTV